MLNCLKASFICFLLYFPFLIVFLIPRNSLFAQHPQEICARYPIPLLCRPSQTMAIIKPDGMAHQDHIIAILRHHGFEIKHDKIVQLSKDHIDQWYFDKHDASYYPSLVSYLTERGPVRVMQLTRIEAIPYLRQLIGPTNPEIARELFPKSIRALYGTNVQENAIHASDSIEAVQREFNIFK